WLMSTGPAAKAGPANATARTRATRIWRNMDMGTSCGWCAARDCVRPGQFPQTPRRRPSPRAARGRPPVAARGVGILLQTPRRAVVPRPDRIDGLHRMRRHMDIESTRKHVEAAWDDEIVPQLVEYIRIPNKSPMFDSQWAEHGYMDQAVALMERWA